MRNGDIAARLPPGTAMATVRDSRPITLGPLQERGCFAWGSATTGTAWNQDGIW